MKISIAERLMPFSHTPGAACIIPGTAWEIEAFPTLLRIGRGKIELKLKLTGPIEDFTLQQDLEKNCVWIFGKAKEGYYRLRIEGSDSGFDLFAEKTPAEGLSYEGTAHGTFQKKDHLHLPQEVVFVKKSIHERLSLGSHKDQNWDLVQKRSDLKEMLPILFCLGQKMPYIPPQPLKGTARLLEIPKDRNLAAVAIQTFLQAAFTKIFIPRLVDDQHQGLAPVESAEGNRFFLVQEGGKMVRNLFFQQNERRLKILPLLPTPLDSGRMIHLKANGIGEIDFEWSKKTLRRLIIRATTPGDIIFEMPPEIKSFRVRKSLNEKGKKQNSHDPLLVEEGKTYFLDRFQK